MSDIHRGVVKWFNDAKGFGFIEHTSGRDVFVHYSVIQTDGFKTLKDGEEVEYELSEGDKGLHAARVVRAQVSTQQNEAKSMEQQTGLSSVDIRTSVEVIDVDPSSENTGVIGSLQTLDDHMANDGTVEQ